MGQTFSLPQCKVTFLQQEQEKKKLCLAVAGGREPAAVWLKALKTAYPATAIYCADKGLAYCLKNAIVPQYVFGDADSAGQELFAEAKALGVEVAQYPAEKDDTDLQLLLSKLPSSDLIISGVFGGRLDHLYSNIFSLLAMQEKQLRHIILADDKELLILLQPEDEVKLEFAASFKDLLEAISLLPLTEKAEVTLTGVHWPLKNAALELKRPYAISNVLERGAELTCSCAQGKIGLYCTFK